MPKRFDEAVEQYKQSAFFDMDATIGCRSTFMAVLSSIEEELNDIDPTLPLEKLKCMKDYIVMQAREKEVEDDSESESESSGVSPLHLPRVCQDLSNQGRRL